MYELANQTHLHLKHLCTTCPAPLHCSVLTQPYSTHLQVIHGILQFAVVNVGVPLLLLHAIHQAAVLQGVRGWV